MGHRKVNGFDVVFGILILFMFVIFLGVCQGEARGETSGKTITVDDDGGANYTTIQWAIDNATAGDTIRVYAGDYTENLVVNKSLALIGNGSEDTQIIAVNEIDVNASNVLIKGFTLNGTYGYFGSNLNFHTTNHSTVTEVVFTHSFYGISLESCNNNSIYNNHFMNFLNAISVVFTDNITIHNNTMDNSVYPFIHSSGGFGVSNSHNILIENNHFLEPSRYTSYNTGIGVSSSYRVTIQNNSIVHRSTAILLDNSSDTLIINNIISHSKDGINLQGSMNSMLRNNRIIESGITIDGFETRHWNSHDIDTSNTVNGHKIHYLTNLTDQTLEGLQGPVILANCHRMTLTGLNCSNGSIGLLIGFCTKITVSESTFTSNSIAGVYIAQSEVTSPEGHEIKNCIFHDNDDAIYLGTSPFNSIRGNTFFNNTNGIEVHGDNTTIINNSITNNYGRAIYIADGRNQTILFNDCSGNQGVGIFVIYSDRNNITGNICNNNSVGIRMVNHENNILSFNICDDNRKNGIEIDHSNYNTLVNNSCNNNNKTGILIYYSHDNMLSNNTLSNNTIGLNLTGWTYHNTIIRCVIHRNDYGITFDSLATINTIKDNAIVSNRLFGVNATTFFSEHIIVTNNWWGHPSGPYNPTSNPYGKGDNITDFVEYDPWLREWSDPTLIRVLDDFQDDSEDNDNDNSPAKFPLIFLLLLVIVLLVILYLVITLPDLIVRPDSAVSQRSPIPLSAQKEKQKTYIPPIHGKRKRKPSSFRSPPPRVRSLPPGPTETVCSHCEKIIALNPHQPPIRVVCPHCGGQGLSERFRSPDK